VRSERAGSGCTAEDPRQRRGTDLNRSAPPAIAPLPVTARAPTAPASRATPSAGSAPALGATPPAAGRAAPSRKDAAAVAGLAPGPLQATRNDVAGIAPPFSAGRKGAASTAVTKMLLATSAATPVAAATPASVSAADLGRGGGNSARSGPLASRDLGLGARSLRASATAAAPAAPAALPAAVDATVASASAASVCAARSRHPTPPSGPRRRRGQLKPQGKDLASALRARRGRASSRVCVAPP